MKTANSNDHIESFIWEGACENVSLANFAIQPIQSQPVFDDVDRPLGNVKSKIACTVRRQALCHAAIT